MDDFPGFLKLLLAVSAIAAGLCAVALAAGVLGAAHATERHPGPVAAEVERVVDGDTLAVRAQIWLGQDVRVLVRLRGIDAPEKRGRCDAERRMAAAAQQRLRELVGRRTVTLRDISGGKYYGRVLARVSVEGVGDLSDELLLTGMVRPYRGKRRAGWCRAAQAAAR